MHSSPIEASKRTSGGAGRNSGRLRSDPRFRFLIIRARAASWFDAMAFYAWLEARLRARGELSARQSIRLPTEEQWEKAARGGDGRKYPWGDIYESGRANINETWRQAGPFFLRQTSAVGIYPDGKSPYNADDMAGNMWEWCANTYVPKAKSPDSPRVLRGGSWYVDLDLARAAYRYDNVPNSRYDLIGFRVVRVSPSAVAIGARQRRSRER